MNQRTMLFIRFRMIPVRSRKGEKKLGIHHICRTACLLAVLFGWGCTQSRGAGAFRTDLNALPSSLEIDTNFHGRIAAEIDGYQISYNWLDRGVIGTLENRYGMAALYGVYDDEGSFKNETLERQREISSLASELGEQPALARMKSILDSVDNTNESLVAQLDRMALDWIVGEGFELDQCRQFLLSSRGDLYMVVENIEQSKSRQALHGFIVDSNSSIQIRFGAIFPLETNADAIFLNCLQDALWEGFERIDMSGETPIIQFKN